MNEKRQTFDDGGPAYPRAAFLGPNGELEAAAQNGMSLLDYFAGQALCGMMSGVVHDASVYGRGPDDKSISSRAHAIAEAMIAEKRRREANRGE